MHDTNRHLGSYTINYSSIALGSLYLMIGLLIPLNIKVYQNIDEEDARISVEQNTITLGGETKPSNET